jgi:outer membrane receptor protein involved in Fe transport
MFIEAGRLLHYRPRARRIGALLVGAAAAALAGGAAAQTQPKATPDASAPPAGSEVAEIVVTALKRDSNLEKTPISMSAVTGANLAVEGVTDVHGLLQTTPSLSFVDGGPAQTRVFIRGIDSPGEPTTGVYYDETPVTGAVGSSSDAGATTPLVKLFDVDRVEALRGPQGTLYGSGSMGGTLRVIFNKPVFDYEAAMDADVTGTVHGAAGYDVEGMVNIPLIKDELAVRVVAYDQYNGGYVDNTFLNQNNVNTSTAQGGRVMARFKPNDNLTIDGSIMYQHAFGQDPKWTYGGPAYDSTAQVQLPYDDKLTIYNLTARWDLGPVAVTAIASDMHRDVMSGAQDTSYFFDKDLNNPATCSAFAGGGSPCTSAEQSSFNSYVRGFIPSAILDSQTIDNPTAELRFSSTGKQFIDWTVGGFFSDRTTHAFVPIYGANAATGALNEQDVLYARAIYDKLEQFAAFGEGSAHLTDKLTLTFGARYFDYNRTEGGSIPVGLNLVGASVTPYSQLSSSESGFVTKTDLSYQFNSNLLAYFSASQGFRPGGVNQVLGLSASLTDYQPDTLWDYEVGVKTNWFDHRLVLDIDGYLINWSDMQVLGHGTGTAANFQFITNAGTAQVKGIETSLTAMPVRNFTIQGNLTVASAVLTSNQVNANLIGAGVAGNRIPYVPEVTGGVSAQYTWPITDTFSGMVRLDEDYVGTSYSEFNNGGGYQTTNPDYSLTNGRIGIEGPDKKWGVYLYVDNIFNNVAITYSFTQALSGGKTLVTSAPPRTVGLNVRGSF